jgi:MarR family transcriptional regulator, transcriptional regulator for hemolysin
MTPIGLQLSRAARVVGRAFDDALASAGGSLPIWLVLLNLKIRPGANQRQLAEAVGITEATLTHHLNAMDEGGLVTRRRDPDNRRAHVVELTPAGETAFLRLRDAAIDFDKRLRTGVPDANISRLARDLDRLVTNAGGGPDGSPWAGLAEPDPPAAGRKSTRPHPKRKRTEPPS